MSETEDTLVERGKRYGNYREQTEISGKLIDTMVHYQQARGTVLQSDQSDALMMIAVKISRILNGDPDYADNWADIAGYATLVKDRLEGNERE